MALLWLALAVAAAPVGIFLAVCICAIVPRNPKPADYLIVLGAKLYPDGHMSTTLRKRCDAALAAHRKDLGEKFILCGGHIPGTPESEARAMRRYLMENGIAEAKIILEDRSVNTVENLYNARKLMEAEGKLRVNLVTSDYHLTRALWIAHERGLRPGGVAAPGPDKPRHIVKTRFMETLSWMKYFTHRWILRTKLP